MARIVRRVYFEEDQSQHGHRQQQPPSQLPNPFCTSLQAAASGRTPLIECHMHQEMRTAIVTFAQLMDDVVLNHCPMREFLLRFLLRTNQEANGNLEDMIGTQNEGNDNDPIGGTSLIFVYSVIRIGNVTTQICKFSKYNNMDPFYLPSFAARVEYNTLQ